MNPKPPFALASIIVCLTADTFSTQDAKPAVRVFDTDSSIRKRD